LKEAIKNQVPYVVPATEEAAQETVFASGVK